MHLTIVSLLDSVQVFGPPLRDAAYLDPGSGSILLQLLVAGLLGFLVLLRSSWSRIKSLFGRGPQPEQEEDDNPTDPES